MTEDPKKRSRRAADQLDLNLTGLLGSLGKALNEAVTRLGHGEQTYERTDGPVRASADIKMRMGGLDVDTTPQAKLVNPYRKPTTPAAAKPTVARPLVFDLLQDKGTWIATAELPGVELSELTLTIEGEVLVVKTSGDRAYFGRLKLPVNCKSDKITTILNNGILTLQFPAKAAE